jgi:hypothetical protein
MKAAKNLMLPFRDGIITEKLLQFIWQQQYFSRQDLATTAGEKVEVLHQGQINRNQGPDFHDARIRIGNTILAGTVELHIRTSQWEQHGHTADPKYATVILHVVYQNDVAETKGLPILELEQRIPGIMLERYAILMNAVSAIPCGSSAADINPLIWQAWKDRLLMERLQRKSGEIMRLNEINKHNWEETLFWLLARSFGMKVNADAFEAMARSLPITLLNRHRTQIHQLECLLIGQCGLLEKEFSESYPQLLQREYRFLSRKYSLHPVAIQVNFLRMRPVNFPGVRLAQLAMLLHTTSGLFNKMLELKSIGEAKGLLIVTANDYWNQHYRFDEESPFQPKTTGIDMVHLVLMNSVIPLLFCYGQYQRSDAHCVKALQWLNELPAEVNSVLTCFTRIGIDQNAASDTQALLELNSQYCTFKKCLSCAIGNSILKRGIT